MESLNPPAEMGYTDDQQYRKNQCGDKRAQNFPAQSKQVTLTCPGKM
jgi:hypothetical protein